MKEEYKSPLARERKVRRQVVKRMALGAFFRAPDELLLTQIPFIDDARQAIAMLQEQQAQDMRRQSEMFGGGLTDAGGHQGSNRDIESMLRREYSMESILTNRCASSIT